MFNGQFIPSVESLLHRPVTAGKVFFVDSYHANVSDSNEGTDPDHPLLTLATALGKCTAEQNDYIFVLDAWSEDTEPVAINKARTHLIGLNNPQAAWVVLQAGTDVDVLSASSSGNHMEVAGFNIGGGSTASGINLSNCIGYWIHNCAFGHAYASQTPKYGIECVANAAMGLIEDNTFWGNGNNAAGTITADGIYQTGGTPMIQNTIIRRNIFMGLPGIAINFAGGAKGVVILDNRFALDADTSGAGITFSASVLGCYVDGNHANFGDTNAMGNIPWVDGAAGDANTWGDNTVGNVVQFPA